MLDTGCYRTMVRRDLVPTTKMLDNAVMVQCAHGDTVAYLLAVVELTVDGLPLTVEAALSAYSGATRTRCTQIEPSGWVGMRLESFTTQLVRRRQ